MHTVADILGDRKPYSVPVDSTVQEVVEFLCECHIGAVAVCEEDRVVGVFSERDLLHRVVLLKRDPESLNVREVMTSTIHSVHQDVNHRVARLKMIENKVRHLVVLDDEDRLAGFLSMRDVNEVDLEEQRGLVNKLNDDYYQQAFKPGKQKVGPKI